MKRLLTLLMSAYILHKEQYLTSENGVYKPTYKVKRVKLRKTF